MNTGARLQAAAPPGGVLVGEATYRATERVIDYREAAPIEAKGKSEPLFAWVALRRGRASGSTCPRPGRRGSWVASASSTCSPARSDRARETRDPQLVTLVGVPGIGKSRLVASCSASSKRSKSSSTGARAARCPTARAWRTGRWGRWVKAHAGILESDDAEAAAQKLDRAIDELQLADDLVAWLRRHLRPLVGLVSAEDAASERSEVFAAWRRFVEALAEQRPAVFVFEDLQWADDGMLDFVDELVDWIVGVPLLVVASARPELLERRPGWGGGKRNAPTVSLSPLSDEDTARLLADLLERSVLPAETQSALLAHAGGNPLFAEEYARMLAGGDGAAAGVPDSLQALVAARVDGLPLGEKTLLRPARCSARCSGRTRWPCSRASRSRRCCRRCVRWSGRSSCDASDARPLPAASSTPSCTRSYATSCTGRCLDPSVAVATARPPTGSPRFHPIGRGSRRDAGAPSLTGARIRPGRRAGTGA